MKLDHAFASISLLVMAMTLASPAVAQSQPAADDDTESTN
jgi:hypothetical protein